MLTFVISMVRNLSLDMVPPLTTTTRCILKDSIVENKNLCASWSFRNNNMYFFIEFSTFFFIVYSSLFQNIDPCSWGDAVPVAVEVLYTLQ